ncbi:MAG TPA: phosphoadenylyl-sulfate reductase [Acidisphaera sp.]|nr:phosphoadenylyl-sulfate reductase [Acidisphaera sp.]
MPDLPLPGPLPDVDRLNVDAAALGWMERIRLAAGAVAGRIVFTTSFGIDDQVVVHALAQAGRLHGPGAVDVVTLDTGRLFAETYATWRETEHRYGLRIRALYPRTEEVQALVLRDGIDGFTRSVAQRQACCGVRKVEPLGRALAGAAGWITGLRAEQSPDRSRVRFAERDGQFGLLKISPLHDASREDVLALIRAADIPYSPLEDRGFRSVGCQPCTRAIAPGEPERAGRWWWETDEKKECGLHLDDSGRLVRIRAAA